MIFVALALALPILSLQHVPSLKEAEEINKLGKVFQESDKMAHDGIILLGKVMDQVRDYECRRNQEDCAAWKAYRMGDALTESQANCDETPENEICKKARDLLGMSENGSHKQILGGLVNLAEGVAKDDFQYVNSLMDAVVDYICYKEPGKCTAMR